MTLPAKPGNLKSGERRDSTRTPLNLITPLAKPKENRSIESSSQSVSKASDKMRPRSILNKGKRSQNQQQQQQESPRSSLNLPPLPAEGKVTINGFNKSALVTREEPEVTFAGMLSKIPEQENNISAGKEQQSAGDVSPSTRKNKMKREDYVRSEAIKGVKTKHLFDILSNPMNAELRLYQRQVKHNMKNLNKLDQMKDCLVKLTFEGPPADLADAAHEKPSEKALTSREDVYQSLTPPIHSMANLDSSNSDNFNREEIFEKYVHPEIEDLNDGGDGENGDEDGQGEDGENNEKIEKLEENYVGDEEEDEDSDDVASEEVEPVLGSLSGKVVWRDGIKELNRIISGLGDGLEAFVKNTLKLNQDSYDEDSNIQEFNLSLSESCAATQVILSPNLGQAVFNYQNPKQKKRSISYFALRRSSQNRKFLPSNLNEEEEKKI